jgi:hypothetical protein
MFQRVRQVWGIDRRGAVVVLVALVGTVVVGLSAMTIDLGNMYVVRAELQRSADSAALAAVAKLAKYRSGTVLTDARNEAERIVEGNPVDGKKIMLDLAKDVEFGNAVWDTTLGKYTFVPGGTIPNAVRVTVRKTADSPNGALPMFFANFFGSRTNMSVHAAAMLAPRDISIVSDLSGLMSVDSQLRNYKTTSINPWNIWICLPIQKGNNGVGNGIDPPPPGNPPVNDGYGTSPGEPGNRGGASPASYPTLVDYTGPTWGRMVNWGVLSVTSSYDPATDPGLDYLPCDQTWTNAALQQWYQQVGYSTNEINALMSGNFDMQGSSDGDWKYRVAVALGLAFWDSGKNNGLWTKVPKYYISGTKGNSNNKIDAGELVWLQSWPYPDGSQKTDMDYWMNYIDTYMKSTTTSLYQTNANFQYRFGLKTFVNYLMESWSAYSQCPDLCSTPEQPFQAVKDAVAGYTSQLLAEQTDDQLSLEVYGTTAHSEVGLTKKLGDVSARLKVMQAAYYDSQSNMGDALAQAVQGLTGQGSRPVATKSIFLISGSDPNVASGRISTVGGEQYALLQAQAAVSKHIQVYCISIGSNANRVLMQQIATIAGTPEYDAGSTISDYSSQLPRILGDLDIKRGPRLIE